MGLSHWGYAASGRFGIKTHHVLHGCGCKRICIHQRRGRRGLKVLLCSAAGQIDCCVLSSASFCHPKCLGTRNSKTQAVAAQQSLAPF